MWWSSNEVERDPAVKDELLARFTEGPYDVIVSGLSKGGTMVNVWKYLYTELAIDSEQMRHRTPDAPDPHN